MLSFRRQPIDLVKSWAKPLTVDFTLLTSMASLIVSSKSTFLSLSSLLFIFLNFSNFASFY